MPKMRESKSVVASPTAMVLKMAANTRRMIFSNLRESADHLFRTFLLQRFLQCLSQFGDADLGERDAIFVIVQ